MASGTWAVDANGNWSLATNWASSVIADGATDAANFTNNITAARTVTIDTTSRTIGTVSLADSTATFFGWTLASSGGAGLTLDNGASAPTITVNNAASTISAPLSGTNGFTKLGTQALTLTGTNPVAGTITVSSGTLTAGNNGTTGDFGVAANNIVVSSGATASVNRSNAYTIDGSITGAGTFSKVTGTGTLTLTNGTISVSTMTLSVGTLEFSNAGAQNVSSVIGGAGAITKSLGGTLTFSGGGANTGAWAVNAGTLAVTTAALTGTSGVITVASGATLTSNASGSIAKPITGSSGSTISLLGATSGLLTCDTRNFTLGGSTTSTITGSLTIGSASQTGVLTIIDSRAVTISSNTYNGYIGNGAIYQLGSGNFQVSNTSNAVGFYIGYTSTGPTLGWGYYAGQAGTLTWGANNGGTSAIALAKGVVELSGVTLSTLGTTAPDFYLGVNEYPNEVTHAVISSGAYAFDLIQLVPLPASTTGIASLVVKGTSDITVNTLRFATTGAYSGVTSQGTLVLNGRSATVASIGTSAVAYPAVHLISGATFKLTGTTAAQTISAKIILFGNGNKISSGASTTSVLGYDITNAFGQGIATIASGTAGSGYIGPPNVVITRGAGDTSGNGAVISANFDRTTGTITGYTIESAGVGYTATPIISLVGGGASVAATAPTVTISSGVVATNGAIEKLDSGTLALSGTNTNTGDYTVSAGTLRIGNAGTTGTLGNNDTSNASVASGAVLAFGRSDARTYSGIISGAGTVTVNGGARATLSGINTFTSAAAAIAISTANSILRVTNSNSIGQGTTFGITVASGTAFEIDGTSGNITGLPAKALSLNGTGISSGGALRNIAGSNSYPGTITLAAASRINSDAGTLSLTAGSPITGNTFGLTFGGAGDISVAPAINTTTGTVTKDGSGFANLAATNSTYTGKTTVSAGTLGYTTAAAAGSASSFGQPAAGANAIVDVAGAATAAAAGGIRFTGSAPQTFSRTINITGATAGFAARFESSGSAAVTHSAAFTNTTTNQTRTYQFGGTGTASNTVSFLVANNGTGAVSLAKADAGTWVLTNTGNTYSGGTTVNGGTLVLSVATWAANAKVTGTGSVTVNVGAKIQTLAGSGGSAQLGRHTYTNLTFAANGRIRIGG